MEKGDEKKDYIEKLYFEKYRKWVKAKGLYEREQAWDEYWPVRDIHYGFSFNYFQYFNWQTVHEAV